MTPALEEEEEEEEMTGCMLPRVSARFSVYGSPAASVPIKQSNTVDGRPDRGVLDLGPRDHFVLCANTRADKEAKYTTFVYLSNTTQRLSFSEVVDAC